MRAEIESLKAQTRTSLNKNAPAFVPGPTPATPTTPANFHKPPRLSLASLGSQITQCPSSGSPSALVDQFDSQTSQDQIHSISQRVNVLSTTVSQLLSTLLAAPGPVTIPSTTQLSSMNLSAPTLLPPPNGRPLHRGNSGAVQVSVLDPSQNIHPSVIPGTGRVPHRPPVNLNLRSAPELTRSGLSPESQLVTPSATQPDTRRCAILSPVTCQTPMHSSSPLSPLPCESSSVGCAPTNSLAGKWEQLGISGDVLRSIVRYGIGPPTKTQQKSIPCMLLGKDLVSQSNPIQERIQSYIIPALQLISNDMGNINGSVLNASVKVLVITATLDEAAQAYRLACGIAALLPNPPKISHCGNSELSTEAQQHQPSSRHLQPHLLIGTPSKLLDPVNGLRGFTFEPQSLLCVILDEMDQLLARNLSEMVTSLINYLPANATRYHNFSEASPSISSSPASKPASSTSSPPGVFTLPDKWDSASTHNLNSAPPSSSPSGPLKSGIHYRQTCIFSCTVPQDVLSYARTLNLRARVLVRREDSGSSGASGPATNHTTLNSPFDMGDLRGNGAITSPVGMTCPPSQYSSLSSHQILKHLSQFYVMAGPARNCLETARERRIETLIEFLGSYKALETAGQRLVLLYCNSVDSVEAVSKSLRQRGIETLALHQDMSPAARHSLLSKFGRTSCLPYESLGEKNVFSAIRALVVYDALAKSLTDFSTEKPSLVVNFELPRAAEDYINRAACLLSSAPGVMKKSNSSNPNSLVNLVHGSNELDMIKLVEGFYRCKIQEVGTFASKEF
ncbi:hypothetical protein PPACK8108_LOCUS20677 [Phakopsora pachyrhizi]|uniref:ATP-dependent RNA helicase n=1 Tax=Phakopsora pachyrhizi TaxID=170000 RepID=A0AAV0BKK2_PHAPC|nr:hypothetical protein PPACK8108_LOCUS20677 [Phakopsora pachyrhizi]